MPAENTHLILLHVSSYKNNIKTLDWYLFCFQPETEIFGPKPPLWESKALG